MSTDAQVLRADRFSEIGQIIQRDAGVMIDRWILRAKQEQVQAQRVHHQVLLDHLPSFLTELGRGLQQEGDPYGTPHCLPAVIHGEQRWQAGWSLWELVRDYQILRIVVLDYLDEILDRSLRMREVLAIGLALDESIAASVTRYVRFCDDHARQQTAALREADRHKNEFLAMLAHELRNPLAPISNSIDILRVSNPDPAATRQLMDIMDRQVSQMSRLVDDLLDMSRIALGKLTLQGQRLDLKVVLTQAVQSVTPSAEARSHALSVSLLDGPLWVEGDPGRLLQVFVNLLNNAVKYTPPNGQISVTANREGSQAVVSIKDNGIGIAHEMIEHIFDLFTQIDLGADRDGGSGGLGIGLSLVRRLVELHKGNITAFSSGRDQGSEFVVSLPLLATAIQPAVPPTTPVSVSGRRILVIEDNADARNSLSLLLKLVGHQVLVAENGQRGIEIGCAERPDVALIDIGLPDMPGYEVARKLHQTLGERTFLVALTGFNQPEDLQHARAAGFHEHLAKPVKLQTLQEMFAQSLTPTRSSEVGSSGNGDSRS